VKLKYSSAQQVRLAAISAQLQNANSSLSEFSKNALREEALQIHKDVETKELLRLEEKAAAKKARAEAKAAEKQARDAAKVAKDATDDDDPPPPKPTLEDCDGDVDFYREELELWQIELDERAARKILDNPKYSLMVRENANRKLRQCAERRHALCPTLYGPDGEISPASPGAADTEESRRALFFKPFKSMHPKGGAAYKQEYQRWQQRYRLAVEESDIRDKRERPEEWARHQKAMADDAERRANLTSTDHRGRTLDRYGNPLGPRRTSVPTNDDGSFIASPSQEKVWGEQSREFARLRGEVVDPPPPVEAPRRDVAYRIVLDGLLVWPDGTVCELPLPAGTRILAAPTPPGYVANSGKMPPGLRLDVIWLNWIQT
jgi:hypothetical protein